MRKALILLLVLLGLSLPPKAGTYPLAGVVTDLDYDADIVTFVDGAGNLWSFSGTEDWMLGDTAACIMSDSGTSTIWDDKIVSVRYSGNFQ